MLPAFCATGRELAVVRGASVVCRHLAKGAATKESQVCVLISSHVLAAYHVH
jgi:hypothetical protein